MNQTTANEPTPAVLTASPTAALVDRFGRVHRSLRVSVTDACNIRCQYCMPAENVRFLPRHHLLSFEHIERFVAIAVRCGIRHLRLTGGEPLLRPGLEDLVAKLVAIPDLDEVTLTTNGMLLADQVEALVAAGLSRVNISLDTLSENTFQRLSRRPGLERVLAGIAAAQRHPGLAIRLNALVLRDVNLDEAIDLAEFALRRGLTLRFIEFMPLDSDRSWTAQRMVSGAELRQVLEERLGPLFPLPRQDPSQPAVDYGVSSDGAAGRLGFIDSVSAPFCSGCDRLRLTAEGKIRNCLFGQEEWDVAELLRENQPSAEWKIQGVLRQCVQAKHAAHGIAEANFQPPQRAMYQIGG